MKLARDIARLMDMLPDPKPRPETATAQRLRTAFADASLSAMGKAYLDLLSMPQGATRARSQPLFAACRDTLAAEMHLEPESVQNMFEDLNEELRRALDGENKSPYRPASDDP